MALRIITADERLAEANLKTTAVIFGPSGVRQDHPPEDRCRTRRRSASTSRRG